jgi:hypothetical protein
MSTKIKIGSRVRSLYKSRWTGVVVSLDIQGDGRCLASVEVTHDQRGNPMRKPIVRKLHIDWLELLS